MVTLQPRVLGLAALLLAVPACGACDAFDPVQEPVRDVPLETLDGVPVELSALRGQPLVIHAWLPSCGVCVKEFPELEAVRGEFKDTGVRFLAVSMDPDLPNIRRQSARLGLGMELLVARGEILGPLHLGAAPSTLFVNREGVITAAVNGPRDAAFFRRRVRDIL